MAELTLSSLVTALADRGFPCTVEGNSSPIIRAVNTLEHAIEGELSFLANPKYRNLLATTRASAVLVSQDAPAIGTSVKLRCNDPYAAVAAAVTAIHGLRQHPVWAISAQSHIDPSSVIGAGANIGPGVTVDADVVIGKSATIYPGCYIGRGVRMGDQVTLYPNVVIYDGCVLGTRVTIHACTVVGEDGLGYAPVNGKWVKIPQAGTVTIEDDVEIGTHCAIDRATLGVTRIGAGTKFSNLIAIGHGTRIGEDCMLVAQAGLAGSVIVGNRVTIAGQAGIGGHLSIGDDVQIGAQSGVHTDVAGGQKVLGSPAAPLAESRRHLMLVRRLPALNDQVRELRAEVNRLRALIESNGLGALSEPRP